MLKKSASFVLSSQEFSQRTPEGTPPVLAPPAALLGCHFEHPAGERIAYSSERSGAWETGGGSFVPIDGRQISADTGCMTPFSFQNSRATHPARFLSVAPYGFSSILGLAKPRRGPRASGDFRSSQLRSPATTGNSERPRFMPLIDLRKVGLLTFQKVSMPGE